MSKLSYTLQELIRVNHAIGGGKILDLIWCGICYGASPKNYLNFGFKDLTSHERKTFLTHRWNQKIQHKFNDRNAIYKLQNKFEFAKHLGESYGRKFARSDEMSLEEFKEIAVRGKVVCKPLCGGQGQGITVFSNIGNDFEKTLQEIKALPLSLVEEWLPQHEKINQIYDKAVNPVRIQTLYVNDNVQFKCATLTLGNGTLIANASAQKAIFALLDVETGVVISDGYDYNGQAYQKHPVSQQTIRGIEIPSWKLLLRCVESAAKRFPEVRHIGWDVAITPNGPVIIEGNDDPGYTAYQLPQLTGKRTGNLDLYQEYL